MDNKNEKFILKQIIKKEVFIFFKKEKFIFDYDKNFYIELILQNLLNKNEIEIINLDDLKSIKIKIKKIFKKIIKEFTDIFYKFKNEVLENKKTIINKKKNKNEVSFILRTIFIEEKNKKIKIPLNILNVFFDNLTAREKNIFINRFGIFKKDIKPIKQIALINNTTSKSIFSSLERIYIKINRDKIFKQYLYDIYEKIK